MSASSVLLVAASIVAVDGNTATIDAGRTQHLAAGDRGRAFYELIVDGIPKRIEVGPVVVIAVDERTATLASESEGPLRPGYKVELRLPVDRMPEPADRPASVPAVPVEPDPADTRDDPDDVEEGLAPSHQTPPAEPIHPGISIPLRDLPPSPPQRQEGPVVPDDYPVHTLPAVPVDPGPAETTDAPEDGGEKLAPSHALDSPAAPEMTRDVVYVSSGTYEVGLDSPDAQYFNQTPRHEVVIAGFSIDRRPLGDGRLAGLSFAEAQAHCEELGLRLPTEQEWEVAAQVPGFVIEPGLFEWTSSWYQAYPGNTRNEAGYGETSRVLRGISDESSESLFTRRFMDPTERNARVGFRCVRDFD